MGYLRVRPEVAAHGGERVPRRMVTDRSPSRVLGAAPRWAVAAAFACHLVLALSVFPPRGIATDAPWFADDFPARFRYVLIRAELLERGQLQAYDPAVGAGAPECRRLAAGGHVWTLAMAAFGRWLGYGRVFNGVALLLALGTLPLLLRAAQLLELGAAVSWVPLVALPVVWTGLPLGFAITGSPIWLCGSALALTTGAAYRRFVVSDGRRGGVETALAAAALGTVHELAAPLVAVFGAALLATRVRRWRGRVVLGTAAIVAVAVAVSLHWLVPFVARRDVGLGFGGGTEGVLDASYTAFALLYPHGLPVLLALYAWAVVGARSLRRVARADGVRLYLVAFTVVPLGFAFVGYGCRVAAWSEPYRYVVPGTFGLTLLAAIGLAESEGRWMGAWRRWWPWASPAVALGLCLWNPLSPPLPLRAGLSGEAQGLVALLGKRVDPEHRLLLEDSAWEYPEANWVENLAEPGHHYFGTHLPSLLPELTGLELVNGAYVGAPYIRHQVVRFETRVLDGRPVAEWSADELRALFDRYAIGAVLVWSDEARGALARHSDLVEAHGGLGRFTLFRVRAPSSRFLTGSGRVVATSLDRIELADLVPAEGRVVIRYHYDPLLRADPPVAIERVPIEGDPIGFVALQDPPPRVRLGFRP